MVLPDGLTEEMVLAAVEQSTFGLDNDGFCMSCGAQQGGCEPDAREYECESCGANAVYGAEEIMFECFA